MSGKREPHPFVQYLLTLPEDRAALAALRRGLGHPPGTVPEMFPYVVPHLPNQSHPNEEAAYYTLAALFALHPVNTERGNMGSHLRQVVSQKPAWEQSAERRFIALLASHPDDLPEYLRQVVGFLKAQEVPVNWEALFYALRYWGHPTHGARIRREWARAFWTAQPETETTIS